MPKDQNDFLKLQSYIFYKLLIHEMKHTRNQMVEYVFRKSFHSTIVLPFTHLSIYSYYKLTPQIT